MSDPDASLAAVTASGTRLESLTALRDVLATQIDVTDSGRDVAALSLRLVLVLEQIDTLSAGTKAKGTALDELAERRKARIKSTPRPRRAADKS